MIEYVGNVDTREVTVQDEILDRHLHMVNHSPDGFNWGYGGSGPCQLAFAMIFDYTGNEKFTRDFYKDFKDKIIANLDMNKDFVISGDLIDTWIQSTGALV